MIPRVGAGFLQKKEGEKIRTTGFSDRVDFGKLAPVKLDPTVVMRVFLSSAFQKMYIKGASFNVYDGYAWKNTLLTRQTFLAGDAISQDPGIGSAGGESERPGEIFQEYIVEPMDTSTLFALSRPVLIEAPLRHFTRDEIGNLALQLPHEFRLAYKVSSMIPVLSTRDLRIRTPWPPPGRESSAYLDFTFSEKERLIQFAQSITNSYPTVFEKARSIEQYLKENYTYSLNVSRSKNHPPIEDFLFYQKKGYCEHFATAMVLILRSLGIPSRLATGFFPEEWNPYGNYYTVRQSDAHAWVEVYFPHSGWITFDPTPPAPIRSMETSFSAQIKKALLPVEQFIDALRMKWDRYVVNYSMKDQMELAGEVQKKGILTGEFLKNEIETFVKGLARYKSPAKITLILVSLALFVGVMIKISPLMVRHLRRKSRETPVTFYSGLLKILSCDRLDKRSTQTPYEFLKEISNPLRAMGGSFYPGAEWLTGLYYRVRFGGETISEAEKLRAEEILSDFLKRLG